MCDWIRGEPSGTVWNERSKPPNENKMIDGGQERAPLGVKVWKSSQKWSVLRSAVRSIAWLGLTLAIPSAFKWYVKLPASRSVGPAE